MVCLLDNAVTHSSCAVFLSPGVGISFFVTPVFSPKPHNNINKWGCWIHPLSQQRIVFSHKTPFDFIRKAAFLLGIIKNGGKLKEKINYASVWCFSSWLWCRLSKWRDNYWHPCHLYIASQLLDYVELFFLLSSFFQSGKCDIFIPHDINTRDQAPPAVVGSSRSSLLISWFNVRYHVASFILPTGPAHLFGGAAE